MAKRHPICSNRPIRSLEANTHRTIRIDAAPLTLKSPGTESGFDGRVVRTEICRQIPLRFLSPGIHAIRGQVRQRNQDSDTCPYSFWVRGTMRFRDRGRQRTEFRVSGAGLIRIQHVASERFSGLRLRTAQLAVTPPCDLRRTSGLLSFLVLLLKTLQTLGIATVPLPSTFRTIGIANHEERPHL